MCRPRAPVVLSAPDVQFAAAGLSPARPPAEATARSHIADTLRVVMDIPPDGSSVTLTRSCVLCSQPIASHVMSMPSNPREISTQRLFVA